MGKVFNALNKAESKQQQPTGPAPSPQPAAEPPKQQRQDSPSRPSEPQAFVTATPKSTLQQEWDERLQCATGVASGVAESFKRLRAKILHPDNGISPRTIMVTSAVPEEGKSFVCANLGISFALGLEQHALMVDCDLRRPKLAKMFAVANNQGLTNYLQERADLHDLIHKTGLQKLTIIPSGPPPLNPSELLGSDNMAAMIDEIASRYQDRYVFFDSPPLQAASETAVLARQVDGVVLVVRWGKSGRQQVRQVVETIGKEKIIGVVFNAYQLQSLESKFKGYYHGYDYYTSGNDSYSNRE